MIISGESAEGDGAQRALIERTRQVEAIFTRAAQCGEQPVDPRTYFDLVVGPMYGYALMMPDLVRARGPELVQHFIASIEGPTRTRS